MNTQELRACRREWINYFIHYPEKRYPHTSIMETVRLMEITKYGYCLRIFYPQFTAVK